MLLDRLPTQCLQRGDWRETAESMSGGGKQTHQHNKFNATQEQAVACMGIVFTVSLYIFFLLDLNRIQVLELSLHESYLLLFLI